MKHMVKSGHRDNNTPREARNEQVSSESMDINNQIESGICKYVRYDEETGMEYDSFDEDSPYLELDEMRSPYLEDGEELEELYNLPKHDPLDDLMEDSWEDEWENEFVDDEDLYEDEWS